MKTALFILIAIICAVVFNSCKDKDDEIINGDVKFSVVEYGSNKPVKYAAVGLLKRTSGGLGGGSYSVITTAYTDEKGSVNFGYQKDWSDLYIDVQHPDYYDISNTSCQQVAKANYTVVLNGVAYIGIRFLLDSNKTGTPVIRTYPFTVESSDTSIKTFSAIANGKKEIYYVVFKDLESAQTGVNILYDSTIMLVAPNKLLDTAYYTITY